MLYTVYTTIAVADLPYPHGLGKGEHEDLLFAMQSLMGKQIWDTAANTAAFWTEPYQQLVLTHLGKSFERGGDMVAIAAAAATSAQSHPLLGVELERSEADARFAEHLPPRVGGHADGWLRQPPRVLSDLRTGQTSIGDGRHRLSYLRSRIQPTDPTFPVLVRLEYERD